MFPVARALLRGCFRPGREHVVVHRDDHRNENDRVVEQVQLDARNPQLREAGRHGPSCQVIAGRLLEDEQQMLDMMKELNGEGDGPE